MNFLQRLFIKALPKHMGREMEMDSRSWVLQCPYCENEVSYWEVGNIRWKAKGTQKFLRTCLACGRKGWQRSYRKAEVPVPLERDADSVETRVTQSDNSPVTKGPLGE